MANKDDKYPFVYARTQLMAALRRDDKLTDDYTTLEHEIDKSKALQQMKYHMMLKAAAFGGGDDTTDTTIISRAIAALAHQVGIDDDDIINLLVNKGKLDPTTRIPNDPFNPWSRDSKQEWFGISGNLKKDIVKATTGKKDSPGQPHRPPQHPPRSNPNQKAYYSDETLADAFGDVPEDYYEDQDDLQDNKCQKDDLHDPGMRVYLQECYKAYKTDSTPKQPPVVKNQRSGPDGKPL